MYWRDRLACFGARSRGTCTNRLTISRQEVEERVLVALRDKLMRRDLFKDFCREYVRELNRLRIEHRAGLSSARSELATVEREIRKLVQAIKDGVSALSIKDELLSLEHRRVELQSRLNAPEMPELLHPRMADVYREKVGSLCSALESEESRTGAVEAIRALIETILLEPDGDQLKITLKGDLAGMLSAARDSKRSPDTGDLLVQIKLVAGGDLNPRPLGYEPDERIYKYLYLRYLQIVPRVCATLHLESALHNAARPGMNPLFLAGLQQQNRVEYWARTQLTSSQWPPKDLFDSVG